MNPTETPELSYGQIKQHIAELKTNYSTLQDELAIIDRQRRELGGQYNIQDKKLRELGKEIAKYESYILQETIIDEDIRAKPGFEMLSIDELQSIIHGIDKRDYTKYGKKRFMDIDKVIEDIIEVKQLYPTWKLEHIHKVMQETLPPQNFYEYHFITQEGLRFSRGGIKIIS